MIQVIPAIDLIDGKCVRLTAGDYAQKTTYHENPVAVAQEFEQAGVKRLHLVDLDGAKAGKIINHAVLERIAKHTRLAIDFGGGIKTTEDVQKVIDVGATWATVGSIAAKNKELCTSWIQTFGADKILLGADVKNEYIAVAGWLETTNLHIIDFITYYTALGVQQIFCTDIAKDGMLQGSSVDLYKKILQQFPNLHLIASGGVATLQDIIDLDDIHCKAVIVGKAIYEGRVQLKDLQPYF